LSCEESKTQLVVLGFDLGWLDDVLFFGVGVLLNADLFVAFSTDRYTDLELTGNLTEILALRVAHDDPLVEECMVGLLIQITEIKLVVADHRVFKEALVH